VAFGLPITALTLIAGGWAIRGLVPTGGASLGAAIGAGGGALAGLSLHVLCAVPGGAHAALGHGGGVVLGLLAGAALGAIAGLRDQRPKR
jgi:hypothetical protein